MKKITSLTMVLLLLYCSLTGLGQTSRDSAFARAAGLLQRRLNLTDSATALVSAIVQEEKRRFDALDQFGLQRVEDRGQALKKIRKDYEEALRKILTPVQWNAYRDLEDAMQKRAIENLQSKNIPHRELGS